MTTVIVSTADLRRSVSPNMFADVAPGVAWSMAGGGTTLEVSFATELDAATVRAVTDRLRTSDAAQEAARQAVRADRDALPADDPLRRLYDYVLGD